ncbi:MAG: glycosyltransferase family 9 protein [Rhodospirillaceae bacterium]|jgi:heptosyltransferase III|nr:glycosyltransferase family 9 protein [Rhodospirillaceae bacterium]MBT4588074.1 glycosyltransferase family 9 protein [Rhodospirillaceae bacterium]MBT5938942.1 glycosyltransferase family 9 protein [Rhodospirillaceae bacterium]MBT7266672.1 glycosyltransferase family 9 protein [Rhodospirillaceae bacterium]
MTQKILIFRRGSIGDAVVSLPALLAIHNQYPTAELRILTNAPVMGSAAAMSALLGHADLITDYFVLPPGGGGLSTLLETRAAIKSWSPDKLIYLSEPSHAPSLIKEYLFFKFCGIEVLDSLPFGKSLCEYLPEGDKIWESESARLLRAIELPWPNTIELSFSEAEKNQALTLISEAFNSVPFVAFSIGGKLPDKDWGNNNWSVVLKALSNAQPNLGLLLIGAEDEAERTQGLSQEWQGPVLNLCGKTNPRISTLVMENAKFFLGHDSGPMHLAALIGTPCVALFSARAKPGVWFPFGDNHSIFYPWEMADGVSNKAGFRTAGSSILSIEASDVTDTCLDLLNESRNA